MLLNDIYGNANNRFRLLLKRAIGYMICVLSCVAQAQDVVSAHGGLDTARVVDGVDLTNNSPNVKLLLDWSAQSGLFTTADCFASTAEAHEGVGYGCQLMAGYFMPLGDPESTTQALSVALLNHQFEREDQLLRDFSFSAFQIDWHLSERSRASYNFSNDWLGGFETSIFTLKHVLPLTENWRFEAEANQLFFESAAPLDTLEYGELSLNYHRQRWSAEVRLMLNDEQVAPATQLDIQRYQLGLSIAYQLY